MTSDQVALTLCASLSAVAVAITNREDAQMQPGEMALIQPALISTLETMSERAKETVDRYSGPVMLAAGLGLWALRLAQLQPVKPAARTVETQGGPVQRVPVARDNHRDDPGFPDSDIMSKIGGAYNA